MSNQYLNLTDAVKKHKKLHAIASWAYHSTPVLPYIAKLNYAKAPQLHWQENGKTYMQSELPLLSKFEAEDKWFVKQLKGLKPDSILEVGCGYGRFLKRINESMKVKHIAGIDFSQSQLRNAKGYINDKRVQLYHGNAAKLPFKDGSFDVVYTFGVLAHVPPPTDMAIRREMLRVAKRYIVHNETPVITPDMFGYDNAKIYRKMHKNVIAQETRRIPTLTGTRPAQFIIVKVS